MPAVFVHGVPETTAVWRDLLEHLEYRDVVVLSPPGFGAPVPDGFAATSDAYLAWLVGELSGIVGPIDLVGHDWGGGHVIRVAIERPDLIRSWTTDIAGCLDPEYVWHDRAQVWQTPGAGEEAVRAAIAAPRSMRVDRYAALGLGLAAAESMADAFDENMGRCILALYRSARQPAMRELGTRIEQAAARPGHVVVPGRDSLTGGETLARRSAERARARVTVLPDRGHWWMCEDPAEGAAALAAFFATLEPAGGVGNHD